MKKLLSLLFLAAFTLARFDSHSQTLVNLKHGTASDTIHKSTTLYTSAVNVNAGVIQAVSIQCATDSVSGTPDTKYVLQRSIDGVHWYSVAGDTLSPTYIGVNTVHPSTSSQLFINPFYGAYARVKVYTGSGTQKSKMWISLRSTNATVK